MEPSLQNGGGVGGGPVVAGPGDVRSAGKLLTK